MSQEIHIPFMLEQGISIVTNSFQDPTDPLSYGYNTQNMTMGWIYSPLV
jgi:hypothetical protein